MWRADHDMRTWYRCCTRVLLYNERRISLFRRTPTGGDANSMSSPDTAVVDATDYLMRMRAVLAVAAPVAPIIGYVAELSIAIWIGMTQQASAAPCDNLRPMT